MKPFQNHPKSAPWMGALLILAASLALVACDNDMNITGPQVPEFLPANSVSVTATLTGEGGGCTEARLFYDGRQIGVKYDVCGLDGRSCGKLEVKGFAAAGAGRHTIEVKVMRQTSDEVTYRVTAEVSGTPGRPTHHRLGPVSRTLREGDSVTFEVEMP